MDFTLARAQHGYSESAATEPLVFLPAGDANVIGREIARIIPCGVMLILAIGHCPECTHPTAWVAISFTHMADFVDRPGLTLNPNRELLVSYVNLRLWAGGRSWKL